MVETGLRDLERALGYSFRHRRWLEQALTHGSHREGRPDAEIEDYERLEFLGDAVLQLVVTDHLFRQHPTWSEGDLTKARSKLVSARPLAATARRLGLHEHVRAGASVLDRPGTGQARILSDVMEAVIAAVYLDSNDIHRAADVIRRSVLAVPAEAPRPVRRARAAKEPARRPAGRPAERPVARPAHARPAVPARPPVPVHRDYKSQLQDVLQKRHEPHPEYRVLRSVGPEHEKIWFIEVSAGARARATGKGKSVKEAEQRAAREALARMVAPERGGPRPPKRARRGGR
ncbi:MAG: hypothetical protein A3K65_00045 [Euryarchaeota archaeon RBG_16_68_12]|nr:MAG: hypothetical protein A3K65_00045 [Euryarchaeota archaeon RBG_16_68_12]